MRRVATLEQSSPNVTLVVLDLVLLQKHSAENKVVVQARVCVGHRDVSGRKSPVSSVANATHKPACGPNPGVETPVYHRIPLRGGRVH